MKDDISPDGLVAKLAAESAIRRLISAYCDAVSRRDIEAARPLFAPDCRIKIAHLPERVGHAACIEGLGQTFATFTFLHQKCDANLIDVDGATAKGRLSVFEMNRRNGEDQLSLIFGAYEDRYIRRPEGWRFSDRRFTLKLRATLAPTAVQELPDLVPAFGVSL